MVGCDDGGLPNGESTLQLIRRTAVQLILRMTVPIKQIYLNDLLLCSKEYLLVFLTPQIHEEGLEVM